MREARSLTRDIEVTVIPYGDRMSLSAGHTIFVTQALGGSFTAMTDRGYMVRVEGKDADAIGEELPPAPTAADLEGKSVEDLVWEQLKTCYDPEIPVNVVELGLVYECQVTPIEGDEEGKRVRIEFTLTAPGCGMGDFLRDDIRQKVLSVPTVREAEVEVVFTPPWSSEMMSDAARLQLGLM